MATTDFVTERELQAVERGLTRRIDVHRDALNSHEDRMGAIERDAASTDEEVAKELAALRTAVNATIDLQNKVLVGLVAAGVTVVASAAAVIFLGPAPGAVIGAALVEFFRGLLF